MSTAITSEVLEQFRRTWVELRDIIHKMPDEEWCKGTVNYMIPTRLSYHIIFTADMYATHMGYEECKPHRKYKLDWEGTPAEDLPDREQALTFIDGIEATVRQWLLDLGDEGLMQPEDKYPWTGSLVLGRALYALRHNQWHIGELNALLRERGYEQAEW